MADWPHHLVLVDGPGCGKTYTVRLLLPLWHKIRTAPTTAVMETGRHELVAGRFEMWTIKRMRLAGLDTIKTQLRCTLKVNRIQGAPPEADDQPRHLFLTCGSGCNNMKQAG